MCLRFHRTFISFDLLARVTKDRTIIVMNNIYTHTKKETENVTTPFLCVSPLSKNFIIHNVFENLKYARTRVSNGRGLLKNSW